MSSSPNSNTAPEVLNTAALSTDAENHSHNTADNHNKPSPKLPSPPGRAASTPYSRSKSMGNGDASVSPYSTTPIRVVTATPLSVAYNLPPSTSPETAIARSATVQAPHMSILENNSGPASPAVQNDPSSSSSNGSISSSSSTSSSSNYFPNLDASYQHQSGVSPNAVSETDSGDDHGQHRRRCSDQAPENGGQDLVLVSPMNDVWEGLPNSLIEVDEKSGGNMIVATESGGIENILSVDVMPSPQRYFYLHFPEIQSETFLLKGESSCTMERDAPWRGRIFYTKNFLTFYGKYFNKAAKVIIPWREILNVEKKMTAGVFPNAIRITALHTKYTFSSFVKRDTVFSKIKCLWKESLMPSVVTHSSPPLVGPKSQALKRMKPDSFLRTKEEFRMIDKDLNLSAFSLNSNYSIESDLDTANNFLAALQARAATDGAASSDPSSNGSIFPDSTQDLSMDMFGSSSRLGFHSSTNTEVPRDEHGTHVVMDENASRPRVRANIQDDHISSTSYPSQQEQDDSNINQRAQSLPRRASEANHAHPHQTKKLTDTKKSNISVSLFKSSKARSQLATEISIAKVSSVVVEPIPEKKEFPTGRVSCDCKEHLKHTVFDEVIQGLDVKQYFHLHFGNTSAKFMETVQKQRGATGFQETPWSVRSSDCKKERELLYNTPFKAPMMPLTTTKCIEKQTLISESEYFYVIDSVTKTPNVPYGETFQTVMRYCLMFDTPTSVYLRVTMKVDFSKSVLWESKIEKGAVDGCTNLVKDVVAHWKKLSQSGMLHGVMPRSNPSAEEIAAIIAPTAISAFEAPVGSVSVPQCAANTIKAVPGADMLEKLTSAAWSGITTIIEHPGILRHLSVALAILSSFLLAYHFSRLQVRWNTMIHKYGDELVDSALFGEIPPSTNREYVSLLHRGEGKHMNRLKLLLREMSLDSEKYAEEMFALRYYWSQFLEDTAEKNE